MSRFTALAVASLALFAAPAQACLSANSDGQTAEGRLSVRNARDAAGRRERPYILTLAQPACLDATDDDDRVAPTREIQIYSTDANVHARIAAQVGRVVRVVGNPFGAHTAHHHAPIVMNLSAIERR